jgi:hypothetical protein
MVKQYPEDWWAVICVAWNLRTQVWARLLAWYSCSWWVAGPDCICWPLASLLHPWCSSSYGPSVLARTKDSRKWASCFSTWWSETSCDRISSKNLQPHTWGGWAVCLPCIRRMKPSEMWETCVIRFKWWLHTLCNICINSAGWRLVRAEGSNESQNAGGYGAQHQWTKAA